MTCTSMRSATGLTIGCALKNTCCFTERQSDEVDKNNNWACLGFANLNDKQKQKRYSESINKEIIHVTSEPTWEPEKL